MYVDIRKSPFEVAVEMSQEIEELKDRIDFLENNALQQADILRDVIASGQKQAEQFGTLLTVVGRLSNR